MLEIIPTHNIHHGKELACVGSAWHDQLLASRTNSQIGGSRTVVCEAVLGNPSEALQLQMLTLAAMRLTLNCPQRRLFQTCLLLRLLLKVAAANSLMLCSWLPPVCIACCPSFLHSCQCNCTPAQLTHLTGITACWSASFKIG